jgi:hypothetical protein
MSRVIRWIATWERALPNAGHAVGRAGIGAERMKGRRR